MPPSMDVSPDGTAICTVIANIHWKPSEPADAAFVFFGQCRFTHQQPNGSNDNPPWPASQTAEAVCRTAHE